MVKLILQQTLEEFNVCKLEISHDGNSFFGTIKLELEIDLYGHRRDGLNNFYIKIQEANYEENYYLKFVCNRNEEEHIYYFEGTDWTRKFNF